MPQSSVVYKEQVAKLGDRNVKRSVPDAVKLLKEVASVKAKKSYKGAKTRKGF